MAATSEEFLDALKEHDKVAFIKTLIPPNIGSDNLKRDGSVQMETGYLPQDPFDLMTLESTEMMVREFRTTVTHNIVDHAKPTLAECKETFKLIPHFDWTKDDDYYIKDSTGGKIVLIKYRATPSATETNAGNFFYEVLSKAV